MAISAELRSIASPYWGLSTRMRGAVDARSNNQIAHSNALQRIGVVGQAHPTEHRQKDGRVVLRDSYGIEVSGYSRNQMFKAGP